MKYEIKTCEFKEIQNSIQLFNAGLGKKHVFFKKNKKRVFFVLKRILLF